MIENPRLGLYGAIIVGARGAKYTHPATGEDMALKSSWRVDAQPPSGPSYRDVALFMQDEDPIFVAATMPYIENVTGVVGLNYKSEPSQKRLSKDKNTARIFSTQEHGDPATPLIEAFVGDRVQLHVLAPYSEQAHVFSVENHRWQFEPGRAGSDLQSAVQIGGLEAVRLVLTAGDRYGLPGDYVYGDHREPYLEAGLWGIFRVTRENGSAKSKLLHLDCGRASCGGGSSALVWAIALGAALALAGGLAGVLLTRRRRAA